MPPEWVYREQPSYIHLLLHASPLAVALSSPPTHGGRVYLSLSIAYHRFKSVTTSVRTIVDSSESAQEPNLLGKVQKNKISRRLLQLLNSGLPPITAGCPSLITQMISPSSRSFYPLGERDTSCSLLAPRPPACSLRASRLKR